MLCCGGVVGLGSRTTMRKPKSVNQYEWVSTYVSCWENIATTYPHTHTHTNTHFRVCECAQTQISLYKSYNHTHTLSYSLTVSLSLFLSFSHSLDSRKKFCSGWQIFSKLPFLFLEIINLSMSLVSLFVSLCLCLFHLYLSSSLSFPLPILLFGMFGISWLLKHFDIILCLQNWDWIAKNRFPSRCPK